MRIEWDSIDGHEQEVRGATDFREFFAAVRPFFDNIDEMKLDQIHHSSEQR